jgi:hypothetical protein
MMGMIDKVNGVMHTFPLETGPIAPVSGKNKIVLVGAEEMRMLHILLQLHHTLQGVQETVSKNNDDIANALSRFGPR